MASIALPGLQSGIDTGLLVQQLVAASRGPLARLEARRDRWEDRADAFGRVRLYLEAFQESAAAVRQASALRAFTVRSNQEDVLTATASGGAGEGAHEIVIGQLAAAERKIHDGLADPETLVGEGVFAYTYDGQTRSIQTTAETTLADLRGLINNDGSNPGVTASLLEYDAGDGLAYHLVLGGNETGADHAITIEDALVTLEAFQAAAFTTTQSAQDAQVRVDGYPAGQWIGRSTNTIDDVLPGVTLELHATGTVRLSLTRDTAGLKEKVASLVEAYNDLVQDLQAKTAYDAATKTGGVLMGEWSVRDLRQQVRLPLVERALGFSSGNDAFTLAGEIGLSLDSDGLLSLDEDALDEAIQDDYAGVLALLGADRTGTSDSDALRFHAASSLTTPGAYSVRAVFESGVLVSAWIKGAEEGPDAWRAAAVEGGLITGAEGQAEQFLQVTAAYAGTGTVEAEVRVRQGIGGRLYERLDALLDPTDGGLALSEAYCEDAIARVETSIERKQASLDRMEARLKIKFAKLEQALTLLAAQRSALGLGVSA
jgi:flagellar hook-associated protein 2